MSLVLPCPGEYPPNSTPRCSSIIVSEPPLQGGGLDPLTTGEDHTPEWNNDSHSAIQMESLVWSLSICTGLLGGRCTTQVGAESSPQLMLTQCCVPFQLPLLVNAAPMALQVIPNNTAHTPLSHLPSGQRSASHWSNPCHLYNCCPL